MSARPTPLNIWPTEVEVERVEKLLSPGYDELERITHRLAKLLGAWNEHGTLPSSAPTLETVGVLYDLLSRVKATRDSLDQEIDELEGQLYEVDLLRLDLGIRDRKRAANDA